VALELVPPPDDALGADVVARAAVAVGLSLEPRRQPFGPGDVADSDCGFDSICFDSPNGRLSESDLLQQSSGALEIAIGRLSFPGCELDAAERA